MLIYRLVTVAGHDRPTRTAAWCCHQQCWPA